MRMNIEGVIGEVHSLPGCSQVAVSHGVFVPPKLRNQGFGSHAHAKRLEKLDELGYNYVICTVCDDNKAQISIVERQHWCFLSTFNSSRTGHKVRIYGKVLP